MFQENLEIKELLSPATRSTSANGSAVDLQATIHPGGRQIKAYLNLSSLAGTTPSVTGKIQDSDTTTSADFTDVSGASFTAVTSTAGGTEAIHFVTNKRYIRAVLTLTANTTEAVGTMLAVVENLTT